jgi:hypothetical protein
MLAKEVGNMTFDSACKFCYDNFKKEYKAGIGNIQDCGDYWIFYINTDETVYGILPIIVYKSDKQPALMTFEVFLKLSNDIEKAIDIPVPENFLE